MVSFKAILTLSLIGAAFATPIEQRAAEPVEDSGAVANSPEGSGMDLGGTDPTADAIEERGLLVRNILRQLLNNKQSGLTIISSTSNAITWLSRPPRRGRSLREYPVFQQHHKVYNYNSRPKENPGPFRLIATKDSRHFCGIISHDGIGHNPNAGLFHLCK
ncbi:major allergen and cytotoxin AspF1 [Trichophyton benhamiae CBS 112371]|uniref:Ribonuclease ARB_07070 n=1 Tax=Arthroderma benhamiae (strain ATCC MYA-4681 / CBS 112371) TaxID=663331 RepID=RNAS_ARTBC|nr:major allergen and cytotoxin AspF1 [Trichophyton benhamiae CBS 112371]D4AS55.1 RecName: Full=Ribonuclease ARB_07070; AltName: Full=Major allergen Asp f 1 homolog; Flags: Precursor [Trichophyton benhamiae CBS 112371]EFE34119.1 major allergen and cytotoxin AspF1 [Trichophyton benhamiae CBS 112371]